MINRSILVAGVIAISAVTLPALADVYYVTYTGIASGTDTYGLFGAAGAILNNVTYTSTYTYNPASGKGNVYYTGAIDQLYGGSSYGLSDPILSASLTMNGQTYNQASSYLGSQYLNPSSLLTAAFSTSSNGLVDDGLVAAPVAFSFTTPQSFAIYQPGGYYPGYVASGYFDYNGEALTLDDKYVSITDGPPIFVPEPASFALLAGAAGVFAMARGTRRTIKSVAYCVDLGGVVDFSST